MLRWLALVVGGKSRPQNLMPPNDRIQRLFERLEIKPAAKLERARKSVEVAVRIELLNEPHALLSKGQWHVFPVRVRVKGHLQRCRHAFAHTLEERLFGRTQFPAVQFSLHCC